MVQKKSWLGQNAFDRLARVCMFKKYVPIQCSYAYFLNKIVFRKHCYPINMIFEVDDILDKF